MKDKLTNKANKGINSIKQFKQNTEIFVQAVAMLTLAGFSFWALRQIDVPEAVRIAVVTALVIIGLRGAVEFIKFMGAERK